MKKSAEKSAFFFSKGERERERVLFLANERERSDYYKCLTFLQQEKSLHLKFHNTVVMFVRVIQWNIEHEWTKAMSDEYLKYHFITRFVF